MALSLIVIGLLLIVSGVQNTQGDLYALLKEDFTGPNNFFQWMIALALIGAIGFLPKMKGFSTMLLALVLLAIFLKRGVGFFDQLQNAMAATTGSVRV